MVWKGNNIREGKCVTLQVAEAGIHRPLMSGIHGLDIHGAYSILLSDRDDGVNDLGHEFTYCGSGKSDSTHQTLTRENMALARNCAVQLSKNGADAGKDWRSGLPVRVVRAFNNKNDVTELEPHKGYRYDGIYKVVKYYPEVGTSGFRVWKYLLRRDDPSPAPWGQGPVVNTKRILKARRKKRPLEPSTSSQPNSSPNSSRAPSPDSSFTTSPEPVDKKQDLETQNTTAKTLGHKIPSMSLESSKLKKAQNFNSLSLTEREAIKADKENVKLWDECLAICEKKGRKKFEEYVTGHFLCSNCQEEAVGPATTACLHNYCLKCLKEGYKWKDNLHCPTCQVGLIRATLSENEKLTRALRTVLPRYHAAEDLK
ncbi:E3 ubiquitin-protein ligase UHRF1-like [Leptidea sinapis]|uniref:E3 ubiquitin-protein ligase UHRF1-like n=1 Tax=Leptidea sinapis TaxID=189913 RepID=UPI0021C395D6|nr:E3 ubiquitin-protein ligase UHRF1-like [Leptidea sinapis]